MIVEANYLANDDRPKFYADTDLNKLPIKQLLSKAYAAERRKLIDPNRAARRYEVGNPLLNQGDTIYLTTADEQGNMVSLIQSLYFGFGSGVTPPELGFTLQNRGALFSLK